MGRVRVRATDCNNQRITEKIQVSKDTSLGTFKSDVAQAFGWPQDCNFGVSLNKEVEVSGDPELLLSDVGICSGDLVWVIDPPEFESTSVNGVGSEPHEIPAPSVPQYSRIVLEENRAQDRMVLRSSPSMDSTNPCQVLLEESEDADLPPYEVYVPQSLKESLRTLETHNLHSLIVAVGHAAFTDLGFVLRASQEPFPAYRGGIYFLEYDFNPEMLIPNPHNAGNSPVLPSASDIPVTTLRFVPMANFLMIYIDTEGCDGMQGWTVQCAEHVIPQSGGNFLLKDWRKLWREYRDQLGSFAAVNTAAAVGCLPKYGLLSLPEETKEIIVEKLGVMEVLSLCQTCKDLGYICSSDRIWEKIYAREFPGSDTSRSGFKEAFKKKAQAKRKRSYQRGNFHAVHHVPTYFPMPGQPTFGIHGNVGGDYDRLPSFGSMAGNFFAGHPGGRQPHPFGSGSRGRRGRGFGQFDHFGF